MFYKNSDIKKPFLLVYFFQQLDHFYSFLLQQWKVFHFFLTALFTVGLGFSIQQIVANPLAIKMGSPATGAHRLTLAGGINSFGTTIGAILLGIALFGMGDNKKTSLSLEDIKLPFIILGLAFIAVAIFMNFSKIEDPAKEEEEVVKVAHEKFNILDYPQLYLGMLGIFIYVGTEVTIISNLPALLHTAEFGNVLRRCHRTFYCPLLGKFNDWSLEWWCKRFQYFKLSKYSIKIYCSCYSIWSNYWS